MSGTFKIIFVYRMMMASLPVLLLFACISDDSNSQTSLTGYNLSQPEKKFKLPDKLNEISGLSAISNEMVACIQDEAGKIYVFDLLKDEVAEAIEFGKNGDYEGITIVNTNAFALRSDGNVFKIKDWKSNDRKTVDFETFLSEKNDAEGICYDASSNRLLIVCKGKAGEGESFKAKKAVYSFDLASEKLQENPVWLINLKQIKDSLSVLATDKAYEHLAEFLGEHEGSATFQPSGIAIHPATKNIFIISSAGKLLVVLNPDGQLLQVEPLDKSLFKQPEGITFLPNGDMLISNEGRDGTANILMFKYQMK